MNRKQKNRRQKKRGLYNKRKYCCWCGIYLKFHEATIEHLIPQYRGGGHKQSNLDISCSRCNNLRGGVDDLRFKLEIKGRLLKQALFFNTWYGKLVSLMLKLMGLDYFLLERQEIILTNYPEQIRSMEINYMNKSRDFSNITGILLRNILDDNYLHLRFPYDH